ncbi:MAG: M14 family metallopeptidase [Xanthomonadales bacterium]|jgi:succinylglutamate desuccinylase|nr:M14 family metallopeptidase [Xanthomonadales bacterium]
MAAPELIELDHLPAGLLECPASALHQHLRGPTLITLRGQREQPLVVSVLQHGNEITGWEAVQRLLKSHYQHDELPRTLVILVGNPLAAKHRLRRLDEQPDFNRCWPGGNGVDPEYAGLFRRIHDRLLQLRPLACIDVHNNTGLNPHYAAVNRIRSDYLRLASLFSSKVVYFTMPGGTLSHSMSEFCPSLTLECGQAGETHGTDHSLAFLEACLHLEEIPLTPVDADAVHLFHMVATVTVRDDVLFGFGRVPAQLAFRENLDQFNFCELPAGTSIGDLRNGTASPLVAVDTEGLEVTDSYFRFDQGEVRTSRDVMPSMLTQDRRVIQQDCLCYLMERIHFEDNEEVTGIDPLPEGMERSDSPSSG